MKAIRPTSATMTIDSAGGNCVDPARAECANFNCLAELDESELDHVGGGAVNAFLILD